MHCAQVPVLILDGDVDNIDTADCLEQNYQRVLQCIQTQGGNADGDVASIAKTTEEHGLLHHAVQDTSVRSATTPSVSTTKFELAGTDKIRKLVL